MTTRTPGPYYAEDGKVWKAPERHRNPDGGESITIGFPVCSMSEYVGADAAETVAELMNLGHRAADGVREDGK